MITREDRVRELPFCLGCGDPKSPTLALCWLCSAKLKKKYDGGWGDQMERLIANVQHTLEQTAKISIVLPHGNKETI